DSARQWAAGILPRFQATEHVAEIISRTPAELPPRSFVDVYAIDAGEHSPAATGIFLLVFGDASPNDQRSASAQVGQIVRREWGSRTDHVPAEPDCASPLEGEQVGAYHILEIHAPIEILVRLDVGVVVRLTRR